MLKKTPRILYFVRGSMPSEEQYQESLKYGPKTSFRNALFVPEDGALEDCDGVAGDVPKRYADAFPSAESVLKNSDVVAGDVPAVLPQTPVLPKPAAKPVAWKPN